MGDALAAFARPRMLSCAARALGIPIIACFHIPTIPQCAAQAAPVPRFAFQTYAVRELCEKDSVGDYLKGRVKGIENLNSMILNVKGEPLNA